MTEERAPYDARRPDERDLDGVQHIGDIIRTYFDDPRWHDLLCRCQAPPSPVTPSMNGSHHE